MHQIILDRKAIASFVEKYCENKTIATMFRNIAKEWQIARGTIVKAFMYPEAQSRIVAKTVERLLHVIALEEETATLIIYNQPNHLQTSLNVSYHHIKNYSHTIQTVDLSTYYNMLSIDGISIFVPKEDSMDSNYIGPILYKIPEFITHRNNHILCKGQTININMDNIGHLYFLGACDWGEFFENITVYLKDGQHEKYPISFPDWCTLENKLDYISGTPAIYGNGENIKRQNAESRIYSISIDFINCKNIMAIKLPFCLNMHIFALSLGEYSDEKIFSQDIQL